MATERADAALSTRSVRTGVEDEPRYIVAPRYEDRYVWTADGWRIAHRAQIVLWTDGNPAVLNP